MADQPKPQVKEDKGGTKVIKLPPAKTREVDGNFKTLGPVGAAERGGGVMATPEEIEALSNTRNAAHGEAGRLEYTCGKDSPEARWARHEAREQGQRLYQAMHPEPYVVHHAEREPGE